MLWKYAANLQENTPFCDTSPFYGDPLLRVHFKRLFCKSLTDKVFISLTYCLFYEDVRPIVCFTEFHLSGSIKSLQKRMESGKVKKVGHRNITFMLILCFVKNLHCSKFLFRDGLIFLLFHLSCSTGFWICHCIHKTLLMKYVFSEVVDLHFVNFKPKIDSPSRHLPVQS